MGTGLLGASGRRGEPGAAGGPGGCSLTLPHCCCCQNTYTNADKLLEAAEQLAQTGECDPEEIYKAARHLEVRIQDFVRRVEQRKLLLDMSVSFHTHTKEVRRGGGTQGWQVSGQFPSRVAPELGPGPGWAWAPQP